MPATGKAQWTACVAAFLLQGATFATSMAVNAEDGHRDVFHYNISRTISRAPAVITDLTGDCAGGSVVALCPGTEIWSNRIGRTVPTNVPTVLADSTLQMTWDKTGPFGFTVTGQSSVFVMLRCNRDHVLDDATYMQPSVAELTVQGFSHATNLDVDATDVVCDPNYNSGQWPVYQTTASAGSILSFTLSENSNYAVFVKPELVAPQCPTPNPTPSPTPHPTSTPTPSPTAGSGNSASAIGDPHMQNVHGERFDLTKPGKHVLINIPRDRRIDAALLRLEAEAQLLDGSCADNIFFFQKVNITGSWADATHAGGCVFEAGSVAIGTSKWLTFGKVGVRIVHGRAIASIRYLNVFVKNLGQAGFPVGGLLGEDDHGEVAMPSPGCERRVSLRKSNTALQYQSDAIASVASALL